MSDTPKHGGRERWEVVVQIEEDRAEGVDTAALDREFRWINRHAVEQEARARRENDRYERMLARACVRCEKAPMVKDTKGRCPVCAWIVEWAEVLEGWGCPATHAEAVAEAMLNDQSVSVEHTDR